MPTTPAAPESNPFPPQYLEDVFTEPEASVDTLAHLGPLAGIAGSWEGESGVDTHPKADGPHTDRFVEQIGRAHV